MTISTCSPTAKLSAASQDRGIRSKAMDVDIGHRAPCTPQPDTRLRCNVRLRDGRSRQELAAGISRSASAHAQLSFVLCTEPASRRTIGINPIEFAFQLLTPQGIFGGRLGEFALQLLGSLRVFGGDSVSSRSSFWARNIWWRTRSVRGSPALTLMPSWNKNRAPA